MKFFKNLRTKKRYKDKFEVVINTNLELSDEQKQSITDVVKQGTEWDLYPSEIVSNISIRLEIPSCLISLTKKGNVITVFI